MKRDRKDSFFWQFARKIDDVISFVAPDLGLRRLRARMAGDIIKRHYEGGSKSDRLSTWRTPNTDANSALSGSLTLLRNRVRDLVRNDGYARNAIETLADNVVGTGILTDFDGTTQSRIDKVSELWESWAGSTACDVTGESSFLSLQSLIARTVFESGECLVLRVRRRLNNVDSPVPFQLMVLEPDYLDTTKYVNSDNGNTIIHGVEVNSLKRPVAYWLFKEHPGSSLIYNKGTYESVRVLAEDVLHLFLLDRAGQVRGVPLGCAAVVAQKDLSDYEDAQLVRQKVAACFTAFIRTDSDVSPTNPATAEDGTALLDKLSPATIQVLKPGEDVTLANPPPVQGYSEYVKQMCLRIASAWGVPYEELTGDYSQVNFSSARMGRLRFDKRIVKWRRKLFLDKFLPGVWKWFSEVAPLVGVDTAGVWPDWTPPLREMIDPEKEIKAKEAEVRNGFNSHSEVLREMGRDPEKVFAQIEKDNELFDDKQFIFDSDARKTSKSGDVKGNSGQNGDSQNSV